jgi:hypothetical protein
LLAKFSLKFAQTAGTGRKSIILPAQVPLISPAWASFKENPDLAINVIPDFASTRLFAGSRFRHQHMQGSPQMSDFASLGFVTNLGFLSFKKGHRAVMKQDH